jgi:tRNA(Arg) A34 adenosine deaminase TadA
VSAVEPSAAPVAFAWPSAAWRRAFEIAWESYRAGSFGVGALVVDGSGSVVSEGRNRMAEAVAPPGQLAGSFLAHAELNALAPLQRGGGHRELTLITTLEPCLLCASAVVLADVGRVEYAAPDTLWSGVERLPELNPFVAGRWPERVGPLPGRLGVLGAVLTLTRYVQHKPGGAVEQHAAATAAPLLALARRFGADDSVTGLDLDELLAAFGPALDACTAAAAAPEPMS